MVVFRGGSSGYQLLVIGYQLLVIGYQLLVIGYRLLVIGFDKLGKVMRIFIDRDTGNFLVDPSYGAIVSSYAFKRGDSGVVDLSFYRDGEISAIGSSGLVKLGVKEKGKYDGDFMVYHETWSVANGVYSGNPNLNTTGLNTLLNHGDADANNDESRVELMMEVSWSEDGVKWLSSKTLTVYVDNDVIKGSEGVPTPAGPSYVTAQELATAVASAVASIGIDPGGTRTEETIFTAGAKRTSSDTGLADELTRVKQVSEMIKAEVLKFSDESWFCFDFYFSQLDLSGRDFVGVDFLLSRFGSNSTWLSDFSDLGGDRGYLKRVLPVNVVTDTHLYEVLRFGSTVDLKNFLDIYEFVSVRLKSNVPGHAAFLKTHQVQMGIMPEHHATNFSIYISRSPFQVIDTGVSFTTGVFYTFGYRATVAFSSSFGIGLQWFVQDADGMELGSGSLSTEAFETYRQNYLELQMFNQNNSTGAEVVVDFVRGKRVPAAPRFTQPVNI